MASMSAMPTDFVLLCVVIFVTSASTFCCQIFGRMCAKKALTSKATSEIPVGSNHSANQVRRRREASWSSRSLSSLASMDYGSSTTSDDIVDDRRYRERKMNHQRRRLYLPRSSNVQQRSRTRSLRRRSKKARRFVRRNDDFLVGNTGTFRRLGIPKGQALPKELKLAMHRLEDKNLSPMPDTVAEYFLPKRSRQAPRMIARRPPLKPFELNYARNQVAKNKLSSGSDCLFTTSRGEEAFQRIPNIAPDAMKNYKQDDRKSEGFPHKRGCHDGHSSRDFVLDMPLCH